MKQHSIRRKRNQLGPKGPPRKRVGISLVAASEREEAQT
jgi:hypothetical protein